VILNFDPKLEDSEKDLDLWKITKKTFMAIETLLNMEGQIPFIAAEHNDHTDLRHIHAIMLLPRISREQFNALSTLPRKAATIEALSQRELLGLAKQSDLKHQQQIRELWKEIQESERSRRQASYMARGKSGGRARRVRKGREPTLPCPQGGMHSMVKLKGEDQKYYCPVHDTVYEQSQGLSL
jgi:hypothetical protein